MLQTLCVGPSDLHGDRTAHGGVPGTQDALLSEAVPAQRGEDAHGRRPLLVERVVSLRGDGETSSSAQRLPAEGQSPVRGVDRGVGSGQAVPELVSWVPRGGPGSEAVARRRTVCFGDVAPHEEVPGAEEERVAAKNLCLSVRASVYGPLAGVQRWFPG